MGDREPRALLFFVELVRASMQNTRTTLNSHPGVSRQQPRHEVERWDNDNSRSNGRGPVEETRSLISVKEAALARLRPGTSDPRWRDGRTGGNRQPPIRGGGQENRATAGLVRTNARGPSVGTQHKGYDDETYFDDDEENVIVLCDTSHCCNEGAKNLCTIALWGIIALAIFNRFLVHFAGFLQHAPSKD